MRNPTWYLIALTALQKSVDAFRVGISDTDDVREVCSGMYGGDKAYVEVEFDPSSAGQVALVMYEWADVPYLGVETPDDGKTFICTTSAVRADQCTSSQLGAFITTQPSEGSKTSIYTSAIRFPGGAIPDDTFSNAEGEGLEETDASSDQSGSFYNDKRKRGASFDVELNDRRVTRDGRKQLIRRGEDPGSDENEGWVPLVHAARPDDDDDEHGDDEDHHDEDDHDDDDHKEHDDEHDDEDNDDHHHKHTSVTPGETASGVQTYTNPIRYPVRKTGYYCVGIVPVTLVNSKRSLSLKASSSPSIERRQATHADYGGLVLFRNTFDGELPAVEYPKINLYMSLSIIYFVLGCGWAYLCFKHYRELLPMQYYMSGTIIFLVIEMLAQWGYYRYINKHGGGTASLAFLFVISILNAARNSLSLFLLLIVSMGLSVVTQSLGSVMIRVRILTGLHFVFGVIYSIGVVQVELDSAALLIVLLMIFPLSFTLTTFLMWIIVSLNGTILHLSQRKQRAKLAMFQRLWRILVLSVIAVAGFFVISTMSLSGRLEEDYAARNWRYRWILLDASLAGIYLLAFAAVAWIWRPSRDNVRFAMSQELAQDEAEADAEDYEIDSLERGTGAGAGGGRPGSMHSRLATDDDDYDTDAREGGDAPPGYSRGPSGVGRVGEENVVFQMGDDSDSDDDGGVGEGKRGKRMVGDDGKDQVRKSNESGSDDGGRREESGDDERERLRARD